LRRQGKERLFAGVLVGSEPTFNNYSNPDPETERMMRLDGTPKGKLGYRSLVDRGFSKTHPPKRMSASLETIIQESVAFWRQLFVDAGIPASKLYPHVVPQLPADVTATSISAAFNRCSRPGWTTYPVGALRNGFEPLYRELKKHGNPSWAGVDANTGMPGGSVDWETYLAWHYNHGAVLVGINTGATGTELPDRLIKSAFSPEAITCYRKFLHGEKLRETPADDRSEARLRRKMQKLQAGFKVWQSNGRDPSEIAQMVTQRLQPLLQAGKISEAEAVIDEAIKILGTTARK
jgi:hypothetical protein